MTAARKRTRPSSVDPERTGVGGSVYPPCPKLTVDAVVIARGKILLVRRGRAPFEGMWALPGGFVEAGESTESAMRRELREETGVHSVVRGLIGVYSDPRRDPRGPTVTVAYRMGPTSGTLRAGDDATGATWCSLRDLPPLAFDHAAILRDALRGMVRVRPRRGSR